MDDSPAAHTDRVSARVRAVEPQGIREMFDLAALTGTREPVERMMAAFRARREYVVDRLELGLDRLETVVRSGPAGRGGT